MSEIKINYDKMLRAKLVELEKSGARPSLLLHACCAPCSSYVIEFLAKYFKITLLYYNPNISPESEYFTRAEELRRLAGAMKGEISGAEDLKVEIADYTPEDFLAIAKGREELAEGGARCIDCYRLRLEYAARHAKAHGFDFFCTTLSMSPHKNASALNKIGGELAEKYGVAYLYSDFKKGGGYLRSCELSKEYGLYRQDFCGCVYSQKNQIV
jgi:predicted adenine nucleotide alpha hydrolase (AANH) superfamily ATPase